MDPQQTLLASSRNDSLKPSRSMKQRLVESSETSSERIEQKLAEFFKPCRSPSNPYTDPEFQQISELLKNMGRPTWASIPRIYTVLRTIGQLEHLDVFIQQSITDIWFPFSTSSLPGQLSPSMCTKFLDCQSIVLTKWVNLEKGLDHKHAHFGEDDALPLKVVCPLGRGGFGNVDKVISLLSGREFARKKFRRKGLRNKSEIASFRTELMILKRLRHQHCIELVSLSRFYFMAKADEKQIGSYTDSKYFGLIMSPVADCNMLEFYSFVTQSPDKMSLMREFFGCLTNALLYLHESKIRHRDIKPTNILVKGNTVYVTDFGISHDFGSLTKSTTTADSAKTMMYAAPEVIELRPRNTKADIWSLGCVFLEMVTVLKGAKIEDMREFFNRCTESRCFWANAQATAEWALNLHEMGTREDNALLGWIDKMLNLDAQLRPTAKLLFDSIVSYEPQIDEPVSFCGSCCREENFTESEDSASEAWEQDEEFTSLATTQSFKSQSPHKKRDKVTETKTTVIGDATATVRRETDTITSQSVTSTTNPWAKYLSRAQSDQGATVSSVEPATNTSSIWEDFFASLDAVSYDSPQQQDGGQSISNPPTNPWHTSFQASGYQRDILLSDLQPPASPDQHIMSTLSSGPAAILTQPPNPFAETDVQTFAPIELPNEWRLFEAPAEIPLTLFDNFYQRHPNLRNAVDFKERSWGIDPPKLSFGHWASPDTLLHAIKTDMQFMKALESNHPVDFEFVINSSPKDLRKILGCMILSGFVVAASNYGFHSPLLLTAAYQPPDLSADITQILLMYGARSDVKTNHGKTPLMAAAKEGNAASVTLLLKYGAPVDSKDEYGETALDKALIGGYESIAGILLNYGASKCSQRLPPHLITPKIQDRLTLDYKNQTNLINPKSIPIPAPALASTSISASTPASPPAYAPATVSPLVSASYTPQAVELPATTISRQAIELPTTAISQKEPIVRPPGPPPYDRDRSRPKNPIDLEHVPIFYTPPLPLLTARDWTGPSYFLQAVRSHQPLMDLIKAENDVLFNLLVSTPIGDIGPDSLAAVARVLMRGGLNINLLLRAGQTGPTPLQYVLEWGPECSEMFNVMVRHGAIINQAGADGSTVLTLACSKGNLWAIRYLIDSGIKIDEQTGPQLINPLLCAAKFGQLGAVTFLISKGANIEVRNSEGRSPLLLAAQFGHPSIVRVLLDKGASISIRSSADLPSMDLPSATALNHAALSGNLEVVSLLLDAGAKLDERTGGNGGTVLSEVAQRGLTEMAAFLISHNADVNASGLAGITPLGAAASAGHAEMVKLLLKHGADVIPKTERLAKKNNHKEVVSLLREAKRAKGGSPSVSFRWFT
jgi:ankyrin repeat protein/serine/threonine protein kinase